MLEMQKDNFLTQQGFEASINLPKEKVNNWHDYKTIYIYIYI